jgi:hypothetical protein
MIKCRIHRLRVNWVFGGLTLSAKLTCVRRDPLTLSCCGLTVRPATYSLHFCLHLNCLLYAAYSLIVLVNSLFEGIQFLGANCDTVIALSYYVDISFG